MFDCDCQLGGTIGDIESGPFIEAFSQFQYRVGPENFCCILVSLIVQVNCSVISYPLLNAYFWFVKVYKSPERCRVVLINFLARWCQRQPNQALVLLELILCV